MDENSLSEACAPALDLNLEKEPDDLSVLVQNIKSQSQEQKAKQSYEQNMYRFEKMSQTFRKTFTDFTNSDESPMGRENPYNDDFIQSIRQTTSSFFHNKGRENSDLMRASDTFSAMNSV